MMKLILTSLGYEEVNISMGADNIFDWSKGIREFLCLYDIFEICLIC